MWMPLLALYIIWRCVRIRGKLRDGEQVSAWHEAGCFLIAVFLMELAATSLSPVDFSMLGTGLHPVSIELMPLSTVPALFDPAAASAVGKVLPLLDALVIYLPIGLLLPLVVPSAALWRRTLGVGVAIALVVAGLQALETLTGVSVHTITTDSILFAAVGASLGYVLFMVVRALIRRYDPNFRREAVLGSDARELDDADLDRELADLGDAEAAFRLACGADGEQAAREAADAMGGDEPDSHPAAEQDESPAS